MKWFFASTLILSSSFACEIKLAPIIVFMSKTLTPNDWQPLLKTSNCSPEITQNVFDRIKNAEGKIVAAQFVSDYSTKINISPEVFEVTSLESLLRKKVNKLFQKINIHGQLTSRLLMLEKYDDISIQCQNCLDDFANNNSFGKQGSHDNKLLWQIQINNDSNKTNLLVSTESTDVKKVYITKTHLSAGAKIDPSMLEVAYIFDDGEKDYFNADVSSLNNFDLTRDLKSGEALTHQHLKAKKIVSIGKQIDGLFKSNGIELTLPVQALESGTLGQTIQVKNLKNKKQMSAEIIGINKVQITL